MITKKTFKIDRHPISVDGFSQMLAKKPTILHISCHGAYDIEKKEFFLQIEKRGSGISEKLYEKKLREILKKENIGEYIKLAFISACHSEKLGEVLNDCGVPVVVAINSSQKVLDKAGIVFS